MVEDDLRLLSTNEWLARPIHLLDVVLGAFVHELEKVIVQVRVDVLIHQTATLFAILLSPRFPGPRSAYSLRFDLRWIGAGFISKQLESHTLLLRTRSTTQI